MTRNDTALKLEARGIKTFLGREGHGFNATLYINDKKAAFVMDAANGGAYNWHWFDKEAEKAFDEHVNMLPPVTEAESGFGHAYNEDADTVMGKLVDAALNARRLARLMKKSTLFRLKTDKEGEWRTLTGGPFHPAAKAWLINKYGTNLGEILNEKVS